VHVCSSATFRYVKKGGSAKEVTINSGDVWYVDGTRAKPTRASPWSANSAYVVAGIVEKEGEKRSPAFTIVMLPARSKDDKLPLADRDWAPMDGEIETRVVEVAPNSKLKVKVSALPPPHPSDQSLGLYSPLPPRPDRCSSTIFSNQSANTVGTIFSDTHARWAQAAVVKLKNSCTVTAGTIFVALWVRWWRVRT
jgi:hypothetical protein